MPIISNSNDTAEIIINVHDALHVCLVLAMTMAWAYMFIIISMYRPMPRF